jgi:hypothetical protein
VGQRTEGPEVGDVSEVLVANEPRQHHFLGSRRSGDGRRAGVVFATLGVGIPTSVIAEFGQNPIFFLVPGLLLLALALVFYYLAVISRFPEEAHANPEVGDR